VKLNIHLHLVLMLRVSADTPSTHAVDRESFLTYFDSGLKGMKLVHLWKRTKLGLNR
jgi:hypothetical protein